MQVPTETSRSRTALTVVSVVLCVLTFGLIIWGAHVNTTRSGMAFPDWPTSNLAPMVTYQPSEWLWAKDRFWEHGHRLFAALVGVVTTIVLLLAVRATPPAYRPHRALGIVVGVVLATIATAILGVQQMPPGFMESFMMGLAILLFAFLVRTSRVPSQGRVVWLSLSAFVAVCLQGTFGGYTVRNNLPDWTSTTHGVLAEIFLMIVIGIALLSSKRWDANRSQPVVSKAATAIVATTWGLTFLQFVLGALTRHTDAWGVSVTFPAWSADGFFPSADLWQYPQVVIQFLHRTTAYIVAAFVVLQFFVLRKNAPGGVVRTALVSFVLVGVQILLGALVLLTYRGELVTTLHVTVGVLLVVLNTVTMYSTFRRPLQIPAPEFAMNVRQGAH